MFYLYVLLSRSNTWMSGLIHRFTPGEFTHASLATDRELNELYSFGRRYRYSVYPGGFIRENVHMGIYGRCGSSVCRVYRVPVTEQGYRRVKRMLGFMKRHAGGYQYDFMGAALCWMRLSYKRRARYFCSQFVAEMLQRAGAVTLPRKAGLMRPHDLMQLPELELVYEGPLGQSDQAHRLPVQI